MKPRLRSEHRYLDHHIVIRMLGHLRYEYTVYRMVEHQGSTVLRRGPIIATKTTRSHLNAKVRARQIVRDARKRGARWPKER